MRTIVATCLALLLRLSRVRQRRGQLPTCGGGGPSRLLKIGQSSLLALHAARLDLVPNRIDLCAHVGWYRWVALHHERTGKHVAAIGDRI